MLLRRITEHVKVQNWFAVFLDFVIVVFGVFIGIQVANWNEARAENELAERYIVQLVSDLQSDIADIETGYRTAEWRLAALTALLEKAGVPLVDKSNNPEVELTTTRPPVENDSITYLMNAASYVRVLDNDSPAYASLVNSGNARLIGKVKPWPCTQSYQAQYQEVLLFEERMLLFRTELIRNEHDAGVSFAGHLPEEDTLDRIRNNTPLAAALSSTRLYTYYHMLVLEELRQRATLLLEALETNSATCDFETGSL